MMQSDPGSNYPHDVTQPDKSLVDFSIVVKIYFICMYLAKLRSWLKSLCRLLTAVMRMFTETTDY